MNESPVTPTAPHREPVAKKALWTRWTHRKWWPLRLLLLVLIMVALMTIFQRSLIYQPSRASQITADVVGPAAAEWLTDVQTQTSDGIKLHGWHVRNTFDRPRSEATLLLYLHGNAGDRRHRADQCLSFAMAGYDVLIFDYRGYGDNVGRPNESGLRRDAWAMWQHAVNDLGYRPDQIVIYGRSLGGGVAVRLAGDVQEESTRPKALVLLSTFSSLPDVAATHFPWLPVHWLLWDRYESARLAPQLSMPILQFHSEADEVVPFHSGEKLFAAFPETSADGVRNQFVTLKHLGHNDPVDGTLLPTLKRFLQSVEEAGSRP